jgi:hypothetical protein
MLPPSANASEHTRRIGRSPTRPPTPSSSAGGNKQLPVDFRGDTSNQVLASLAEIIELDKELAELISGRNPNGFGTTE